MTYNADILGGKPTIRGRRLAVEHVLGMLAAGDTPELIMEGNAWMEREDILAYANERKRALITLDKDVGTLIMRDQQPRAGLLRIVTDSVQAQTPIILEAIEAHGDDLIAGHLSPLTRTTSGPPSDAAGR